jgi:EmrB/QacA subfamily drug resistance transporter
VVGLADGQARIANTAAGDGVTATDVAPPVESPRGAIAAPIASGIGARLAPLAVASALFMEFVDSTALSTALPTLAKAFHSDPVHLKVALTSYLLALAVFAPASGWVADRFGARRVFLIAMGVFLAGSALCGLSDNLPQLVAARVLQGAGGAMMTPVGRLIVVGTAPRERLVSAMAWFTTPALVGPLVGPPLAGFILEVADWRWIFFINLPVGALGMAAVLAFAPRLPAFDPGRFDLWGFAVSGVTITALVVLAETFGVGMTPPWAQVALLAVTLLGGWIYVRHAARRETPILNLRLLKLASFRASLLGGSLVRLGLGATPFLMPLLLQTGLGWSPGRAGLVTISMAAGAMAVKPLSAGLLRRFGFRTMLLASVIGTAVLTAVPGFFRETTPVWLMVASLALGGFVRSMQFTSANTIAYAEVDRAQVSQASTLATVAQQVGMSLGVSFGALLLHLARGSGRALTPDRFLLPFVAVGAVTLLAIPVYGRLSREVGADIAGR